MKKVFYARLVDSKPHTFAHVVSLRLWLYLCLLLFPCLMFASDAGMDYEVVFSGLETTPLESLLRSASQCEAMKTTPPASRFALVRRAKKDEQLLTKALQSRGYFAAKVTASLHFDQPNHETAQITFHVKQGTVYRFGHVTIQVLPEGGHSLATPTATTLALVHGEEAIARKIFTAEERLLKKAKEQGFAFAKTAKRHTQVDHDQHTLDVSLSLDVGEKVRLGAVTLTGSGTISMNHLMARIPWKPGDLYHPKRMEKTRHNLLATGLFNIVRIHLAPKPDKQGTYPVTIDLVQRKHRSIRSGLGYGTSTGAKLSASWEHRNIFSAGEKIEVKGHAAMETQNLESTFNKPDFLRIRQKLLVSTNLDKEESKAFHKDSFGVEAGLSRPLTSHLDFSYGLGYRVENIEDKNTKEEASFGLLSTPVKLTWDKRDNILNPSKGWYMGLAGSAIVDTLGTGIWFGKFSGRYRHYRQLLDDPKLVLAGRIGIGTIIGPSQKDIPADERFFVGGGGSLRGYGFQMANDVDMDKKPVGGRSMLEFSSEVRLQLSQSIGIVAFLDGGRAFASSHPDLGKEIFLGPGGGVRYHTPIGPLRLDVGIPWRVRPEIDHAYQIYMSIGQAF